jgi:hypothetical protein
MVQLISVSLSSIHTDALHVMMGYIPITQHKVRMLQAESEFSIPYLPNVILNNTVHYRGRVLTSIVMG